MSEQDELELQDAPVRVARAERRWNEERCYTTLEAWQLSDVIECRHQEAGDGRKDGITFGCLLVYLAIQTFGRSGRRFPGDRAVAERARMSQRMVRVAIGLLVKHGWITLYDHQTESGRVVRGIVCNEVRHGGPARNGGSGHPERPFQPAGTCVPDESSSSEAPNLKQSPPTPPQAGGGVGGSAHEPKTPRASKPVPEWARTLAQQLGAVYPHGITETGRVSRPGPTQVARRLVQALAGVPASERPAVTAQLLTAAQAEAAARPVGSPDRRYSKGLDVWIHQRCWEAPAEVVAGGGEESPVVASWRRSCEKMARDREARHAADPTRTPVVVGAPEAPDPRMLAARERLEASRQEALARAREVALVPGPLQAAAQRLLASAGEAPGSLPASGTSPDPTPPVPSDPGAPDGPRKGRPRRPRAEILAELEEHRRKLKETEQAGKPGEEVTRAR